MKSPTFNKTIFERAEHFSVVWSILHNPAEWGRHAINYFQKNIQFYFWTLQQHLEPFSFYLVSFSLTLSRDNDPDIWKELRQHWLQELIILIFLKREAGERHSQTTFPSSINQLCTALVTHCTIRSISDCDFLPN